MAQMVREEGGSRNQAPAQSSVLRKEKMTWRDTAQRWAGMATLEGSDGQTALQEGSGTVFLV